MPELSELGVILLYVFGMALVLVEVFLPGAVLGIIGLGCVLVSIWICFTVNPMLAWLLVVITIVSLPFFIWMWVRVFNRVLAIKTTQKGTTSAQVELKVLVGKEGVALTTLRPAGMARIDNKKIDVVSEGPIIEKDACITVLEVEANRVVVREVTR